MGKGAGKGANNRARDLVMARKRARKAANKAKYQAWKEQGVNTKSRRAIKKRKSTLKGTHPFNPCGNLACDKCYEQAVRLPRQYIKVIRLVA